MIAHVVTTCHDCPYVNDDEQPWLCTLPLFSGDPDPRVIGEVGTPPPAWCPLRQADRLVTLRSSR